MKILCIGGGPAGLYFALLMKKQNPQHAITVIECHRPYDTFGWGVVFSDATFDAIHAADEPSAHAIMRAFHHWDQVQIEFKGERIVSHGHGFCAIGRKRLLTVLQERCRELEVQLLFETEVLDDQALAREHGADLVIASDGMHSKIRERYAATYQPFVEQRKCRFVWLGTRKSFEGFTFSFEQTEFGWFQSHAYRFDDEYSNFIIEAPEQVWQKAGLDHMSQTQSLEFCEKLFKRQLGGAQLLFNAPHLRGSGIWIKFEHIACGRWVHWNEADGKPVPVVLLGDAAHTTHYSLGLGTKMALEDAIALAGAFSVAQACDPDLASDAVPNAAMEQGLGTGLGTILREALQQFQARRIPQVERFQLAGRNSMDWFENVQRYTDLAPPQFAYSLLTRSQRLSHESLKKRDPDWVDGYEAALARQAFHAAGLPCPEQPVPPMLTPFRLRELVLPNRIVMSPMAQYSAKDGEIGDYHLVHLGARALGGAGLIFTEMVAVSALARPTPACPGLYAAEHLAPWQRVVDFVHQNSSAKIALQLGHAGPKGSTRRGWEGRNQPLESDNWPLLAASEGQFLPGVSQIAREASLAELRAIVDDFVRATQMGQQAGFDWLELHCAHGYLLSSFISPLTNRRQDQYGGTLENRCRYPLAVFAAIRAVWPAGLPISVSISAHDWVEGGITPDDAVAIARLFKQAGVDMIDCSSGQVSSAEHPGHGRMFQTPFADRVRNEAGIPTIAVGAIYEADHANGIIAAGRADLCAIGRPHLVHPAWTLDQSAKMGYGFAPWPKQYHSARMAYERHLAGMVSRDK
jgi:anthraniloyl-CoA monooxygenase